MKSVFFHFIPVVLSVLLSGGSAATVSEEETAEALANLEKSACCFADSGFSTAQYDTAIQIYNHKTGETMVLTLDDYLVGVVTAEMPLSYGAEALKAQAVAARTFVYYQQQHGKAHPGGAFVCTDYHCCQAWQEPEIGTAAYRKARRAVDDTRGVIVLYEGQPINAMYFSSSGGYTESYAAVWGGRDYAYLQSVPSGNEEPFCDTDDVRITEFSASGLLEKLRAADIEPETTSEQLFSSISKIVRSESGRVQTLRIGAAETTGIAVRNALSLTSTNFYFKKLSSGRIAVIAIGYGHGVGMSQSGAGAMAAEGYSYTEILKHYYTGVTVQWQELC